MERRNFFRAATAAAVIGLVPGCRNGDGGGRRETREAAGRWGEVRRRFIVDDELVHMAGMLIAPHPDIVRDAVARHRDALDREPVEYVQGEDARLKRRSRDAAAGYMGVSGDDVGLTDSTTMGIGLVYNGVRVRPGQVLLTTNHDYPATHDALDYRAARDGVTIRRITLFDGARGAETEEIVDRLLGAVDDDTRVIAATWVHSSTGLKLPIRRIADRLEGVNAGRDPSERVLLCLDGVHGLGVEDEDIGALGCDFFFAGTHKWMFAPRGTGVVWGRPGVQDQVRPTIPTFTRDGTWGGTMTPGGFKPIEHQWSMAEAFAFHDEVGGRSVVAERIHTLAGRLKEGLGEMPRVTLRTPMDAELSSGIVCFDVEGLSSQAVVDQLRGRDIIASVTPYEVPHARLSPGLLNADDDVERTLEAVQEIA